MDPATRIALEALYSILLSAVVQLARVLGKECPAPAGSSQELFERGLVGLYGYRIG